MHKTEGTNHALNLFANGPPGTRVEQNWLNAVQNEIRNVVEGASLTLKTAATETGDQLLAAINLLIAQNIQPGSLVRPVFEWKDADEIYIGGGVYHHAGTTDQIVYWDSQLTYQFTGLAATDWIYLYIDDSAVVTLGTNVLTVSEFIDNNTEPAWDHAKKGWYNGLDRCIMAIYTDGTPDMLEFHHDGGDLFQYGNIEADLWEQNLGVNWTDVTLTIPKFATAAQVLFKHQYVNGDINGNYRTNGDATAGHPTGQALNNAAERSWNSFKVLTDTNQKIEVQTADVNDSLTSAATHGYYFPAGM